MHLPPLRRTRRTPSRRRRRPNHPNPQPPRHHVQQRRHPRAVNFHPRPQYVRSRQPSRHSRAWDGSGDQARGAGDGRRGIRGSIICTASVAAAVGGFAPVAYTIAKHGVLGLVKAAAGELGEKGVRVNCVSPFGVATPLSCGIGMMTAELVEKLTCEAAVLKGAVLRAADIAAAALFLASDDSAFISGQNIVVDGAVSVSNALFSKTAKVVMGEVKPTIHDF
ncbi:Short-chain dehydrogenase reductase 3b [Dendrobium catenatum]|uniref:Short-chain dehydrogenase reductase 3b n=1 Tax=Dendrobium catenatum TaxID=906689 RepID=A0A2I0VGC0_9ASPA|nr:Short-chain dehydrogenase reductase 3b [Dendrobium catenatum]